MTRDEYIEEKKIMSLESRQGLAHMVLRLFELWKVPAEQQALVLRVSIEALARFRAGDPLDEDLELVTRVGWLMAIHKALRLLYPHDNELAYGWISMQNSRFNGLTPLQVLSDPSRNGLREIEHYLSWYMQA